jgi:phasin family protein
MNATFVDLMNTLTKNTYDATLEMSEINLRAWDRLAQQQVELVQAVLTSGSDLARRMLEAKDYQEVVSAQTEAATDYAERSVEGTRKTLEVLTETRDTLAKLAQRGMEQTMAETKKAASAATAEAAKFAKAA